MLAGRYNLYTGAVLLRVWLLRAQSFSQTRNNQSRNINHKFEQHRQKVILKNCTSYGVQYFAYL